MTTDGHLNRCCGAYNESLERFEKLTAGISKGQALWRPAPDSWSVAECLDHLTVSAELYFGKMGPAFSRARRQGHTATGPWRRRTLLGKLILRTLDPTAGRTFPAPSVFKPAPPEALDVADVRDRFRLAIARLLELAKEADGLDLDQIRFATPASPFPRITAAEAFQIQALHIPRHLEQAARVMKSTGFPGA